MQLAFIYQWLNAFLHYIRHCACINGIYSYHIYNFCIGSISVAISITSRWNAIAIYYSNQGDIEAKLFFVVIERNTLITDSLTIEILYIDTRNAHE